MLPIIFLIRRDNYDPDGIARVPEIYVIAVNHFRIISKRVGVILRIQGLAASSAEQAKLEPFFSN